MLLAFALIVALFAPQQPGASVIVDTTEGRVHVGNVVADNEHELVLDVGGKTLTLSKERIARVTQFAVSEGPHSRAPLLPAYPLLWLDSEFGFDYVSLGLSLQPRRFFVGTLRYGNYFEHHHEISPEFSVHSVSVLAGATLKVPLARATVSIGPSFAIGVGRGRFLYEDGEGERFYSKRRGIGAGVTVEARVAVGPPFAGLGMFILFDANTFLPYGSVGLTLEFGRIARMSSWRPQ
jgi:hypothetical protein